MSYGVVAKRSAVSTVIGMLFFIVIMGGAFAAFIVFMSTNADLFQIQMKLSEQEVEKTKETFTVFAYGNSSGHNLQVDIENRGKKPLEIVDLWIINKTASVCPPCESKLIEIEYADSFVPIRSTVNILANTPVSLAPGLYDLKAVSSLGNMETLSFFRVGSYSLSSKLIAMPPIISNAANTTLILNVVNNSSKTFYNVRASQPTVIPASSLDIDGDGEADEENAIKQNPPFSVEQLDPNESFTFTWNYELRGATGTSVKFVTNATAKREISSGSWDVISNNDTATVTIQSIPETNQVAKPEIFVVYPNPIGKNSQQASQGKDTRGFWGTMVVNNLNQTITVHQVTVAMQISTQGPDKAIDKDEDARQHIQPCCLVGVDLINNDSYRDASAPGTAPKGPDGKDDGIGKWTVPEMNVLQWNEDPTNPIKIPPLSAREFVVKIRAIGGGSASGVDTFLITANVHTDLGQFTNVGHSTSQERENPKATVINVYPTSINRTTITLLEDPTNTGFGEVETPDDCYNLPTTDPNYCRYYDGALRYRDDDFNATRAIDAGEVGKYYITVREGHKHDNSYIPGTDELGTDAGQNNLVLGFPPGFPDITFNPDQSSETGSWKDPEFRNFADGSKQLIIPIKTNIGDKRDTSQSSAAQQVDTERRSFEFCVTAPTIGDTKLYVFSAYVEGRDSQDHVIGPVSEAIVLRVVGTNDPEFGNIPDQASDCQF